MRFPGINILDRYLIKKFLSVLFFALAGMVTIFVAVNYVENADRFIDRKVPGNIIAEYYLNFIPHIITLTLPVDILLASLFSIGSLARFNELTAIKAGGRSLYRVLFPIIVLALLVSAVNFYISEAIVPPANITKSEIWKSYVERASANRKVIGTDIHIYDPSGTKVFIDKFDKRNRIISVMSIQQFYGTKLISRIDAGEATWDSTEAAWMLRDVVERRFTDSTETVIKHPTLAKHDLFFDPNDILRREQNPDEMNFIELRDFISKLKRGGAQTERWETDYQLKFAYPLTCFFMVLFGAPLAASRKKSGAGINIFFTLVICLAYWSVIQTGRFMGYNQSMDPVTAAWLGNSVFGVLSLLIFLRMKS
ncbi:LptF/LptG family permease [bacterium]|nr:LptF/LptG family permease [bacterium]NUN44715.1 YjgP/YjgQ family permease [bacterium]